MIQDDRTPLGNLVPTAEHTLRLIERMLARPEGWTPQELLVELDLSRSSLFVLLRTLKALGYIEQQGKRGRYVPGPRLLAWRAPLSPSAQDLLSAFYQETEAHPPRETLALVVRAGRQAGGFLVLAQTECAAQVRSTFSTGEMYPHLPAVEDVFDPQRSSSVVPYGFAIHLGEETIDLALPVCRDGHTPEAALLLSAPAFRWTPESLQSALLEELRGIAAHLSYRLGAPVYAPYHARPQASLQSTTPLTGDEIGAFLRGPWAASLACVRPDGRPHVIPVWQEWDGQAFYVIAWQGSQWAEYLTQNPNVSLTIDEPWAPLRRVVVRGQAAPFPAGREELNRLVRQMARRYLGAAETPVSAQQVLQAFQIRPDSVRGWRGLQVLDKNRTGEM